MAAPIEAEQRVVEFFLTNELLIRRSLEFYSVYEAKLRSLVDIFTTAYYVYVAFGAFFSVVIIAGFNHLRSERKKSDDDRDLVKIQMSNMAISISTMVENQKTTNRHIENLQNMLISGRAQEIPHNPDFNEFKSKNLPF
jgi:hypothetical protein